MKLSEHQLRELIKVVRRSDKVLYGYCPKCNKNEFGISLNEGHKFGCFRKKNCGFTGNIFSLLKYLKIPLSRYSGGKIKVSSKIEKKSLTEQSSLAIDTLPEIRMPIGFRRCEDSQYLRDRGMNDDDFKKYVCGYTNLDLKQKGRVIIGITQNYKLVSYIGRALSDEIEPKYLNSKSDFSKILDGLKESSYKEATLVEGLFDRINTRNKFKELGIESRVICGFGAKLSDDQIQLMLNEGIETLNLFFDPDVFRVFKKTSSKVFHKFKELKIMKLTDKSEDPGSSNVIQIGEAYLNRQNFVNFTKGLPNYTL